MRIRRMGKDGMMVQTRTPWRPQPDELPHCSWYGGHLADGTLFVSDMNACPLSRIGGCPRACVGMRPDGDACGFAQKSALPETVAVCATNEVLTASGWKRRIAERA